MSGVFTVEGELDGRPYTVEVGGPAPLYGAAGHSTVTGYLAGREGDDYMATPTGPHGVLDMRDPGSVLGALLAWTSVRAVTGDAPDLLGGQRGRPGTVY